MTAGSDYTAKSGTFSFAPGVTNQSTGITILNDALTEPNETVTLTLSTWLWPRRPEAAALRSNAR